MGFEAGLFLFWLWFYGWVGFLAGQKLGSPVIGIVVGAAVGFMPSGSLAMAGHYGAYASFLVIPGLVMLRILPGDWKLWFGLTACLIPICLYLYDLLTSTPDESREQEPSQTERQRLEQGFDYSPDKGWTEYDIYSLTSKQRIANLNRLIDKGIHPNMTGPDERTALHAAAYWGDYPEVARVLLDRGVDIKALDSGGMTPLHAAASYRCVKIVKLLLENGAAPEARDKFGRTPLDMAKAAKIDDKNKRKTIKLLSAKTSAPRSM